MSDPTQGGAPAGSAPPGSAAPEGEAAPRLSDQEVADLLYGDTTVASFSTMLRDSFDRLSDMTGMTKEERASAEREAGEFFDDARIYQAADASRIHSLMVTHGAKPATPDQVEEWNTASRRYLRETFGAQADAKMAKVKEFVAARPKLSQMLARTGLGSHPDVIKALTADVHNLRITPRKKR